MSTLTISLLIAAYVAGALAVVALRVHEMRTDPTTAPGGGVAAIAVTGLLWPVVLTIAILVLVLGGALGFLFDKLGL